MITLPSDTHETGAQDKNTTALSRTQTLRATRYEFGPQRPTHGDAMCVAIDVRCIRELQFDEAIADALAFFDELRFSILVGTTASNEKNKSG